MGFKNKYYKSRLRPKHLDPKCLTFSLFTANDVRNLSVTQIVTSLCFNILGHPIKGGLYDPVLGPLANDSEPCGTCGGNIYKCPGHFGHIELPVSVVNPLFHKRLYMLLKLSCLRCFTFQVPPYVKLLLAAKLKLLYKARLSDVDGLSEEVRSAVADSQNAHSKVQTDYIRDIIETYVQNVFNRSRFSQTAHEGEDDDKTNTKTVNIQWHVYIENVLKQYTAGKICINCQEIIPKVSMLQNKIMTSKLCSIKDTGQEAEAETETEAETEAKEKEETAAMSRQVVHKLETVMIMADQSKEYLRQLWRNERDLFKIIVPCLDSVDIEYPTDVFFLEAIPVLPPIVRPVDTSHHNEIIEHPQTQVYKSIMQDCLLLKNIIQTIQDGSTEHLPEEGRLVFEQVRGHTALEKLHNAWQMLQINVDHLIDREMSKTSESNHCQGLKQIIEKKEGIIRMHMMGKRVNFAARSVITPDPNLNIDEIGVPEAFALKLTYPVPVTPWNVVQLRQLVLNGPNVHPGAVMVENEDGLVQAISGSDFTKRQAIAKRLLTPGDGRNNFFNGVKVIYRHLRNGDVLLVNRQPTLHRPSIMAHKARILKDEKTLRLHYANCKAYNADFDGDETNIHFPQNELARSEGYNLANVSNQYLVPKDGTPLSGLIQDHMVSGVRLTTRGRFFSRSDYMQLVYIALSMKRADITLLPPAIVKPVPQWSGKQIVSTVIINIIPPRKTRINLTSGTKISMKEWQVDEPQRWKCGEEFKDPKSMSEAEVIIRHGELLCGVLDKTHYGSTPYGLIHCIYELYGGTCASQMLSAFGKLFQAFLQWDGFTLGIEDILVERKADKKRKEIISNSQKIGEDIQKAVLEVADDTPADQVRAMMEESYWSNPKFRIQLDRRYKSILDVYTNDINKTCLPTGLFKRFPDNNLQLMVQSGAKGSTVNTMQISCLLGQMELEGKRPPLMISGKSLPSFLPYDPTPRAGGFIAGRFMTGIKPQEFFFHCMAGREGLIDTAVKTSRSGYLQRCLVKHLEGLMVGYDSTVRDSDGSLIQWYYGEDGLDISGSRFLKREQMVFLIDNRDAIIDTELLEGLQTESDSKKIAKMTKKIKKWENKNGSCLQKRRISEFSRFSVDNAVQTNSGKTKTIDRYSGRSKATLSLLRKWIRMTEEVKNVYHAQCVRCPDPVMSVYKQDIEFGVLSERLENLLDEYNLSRARMPCIGKSDLRNLLSMKVMKTICPPGEPVGLLAAQSIGEPSTQMTLNTFHHAGRGDMNVTLGIPRLREILMLASKNIKTPSMEIPFRKDCPGNLVKQSNELKLKLTKCVLSDILKNITVSRKIEEAPRRRLVHTITIEFLLRKYYKSEFCVRLRDAIKRTEENFFRNMFKEIKRTAKVTGVLLHFEEDHNKKRINDDDTILDEVDPDEERSVEEHSGVEGKEGRREGGMRKDLGETHESSDEEEAAEDADATMSRLISRHQENQEYEDLEEEEEIENVTNNGEEGVRNNSANRVSQNQDDDDDDDDDDNDAREEVVDKNLYSGRRSDIVNMYRNALEYDYDEKKFSWCKFTFWLPLEMIKLDLPTIIKSVANKTVLWETPCIKKAFVLQNNEDETILKTDGLNIVEMFKYNDILDLNRLYSNDIYNICQTYGIEAGNRVIKKEIKEVFKMYGITVDYRHLSLIADYMTFNGQFQPFNRKGMENSASPLQQISFESSLNFLKNATLRGRRDDLFSPSSRLMLGQPCKSGTGACSMLIKLQK